MEQRSPVIDSLINCLESARIVLDKAVESGDAEAIKDGHKLVVHIARLLGKHLDLSKPVKKR